MTTKGNWFLVKDIDGFDLEIGDWARLTENEYHQGKKFNAGQPVKITNVIMDHRGIQLEVVLHQTVIFVPPNRLRFYGGKDSAARRLQAAMAAVATGGKPSCPVCRAELQCFQGADYCNSCRMPLWEILQGLAKSVKIGG